MFNAFRHIAIQRTIGSHIVKLCSNHKKLTICQSGLTIILYICGRNPNLWREFWYRRIMARIIIILLSLFLAFPNLAYSQKAGSKLGADFSAGYVFPSHKFLTGRNYAQKPINTTISAHLKYGVYLDPDSDLGRMYPDTYHGIGISYHNFFNDEELGSPYGLYIFQHSRIASLSSRLSLDYEWDFGINWNWKKYDIVTNPYNRLMGSSVTAYINIGLMLNWSLAPKWNLTAGVDFTHVSNGDTALPNYGLNTMTLRTGIIRNVKPVSESPIRNHEAFKRHVSYDLIMYGSWRKKQINISTVEYVLDKNFAVAGLNFNPMYNVVKYFRAGLSLDMLYDRSTNIQNHIIRADKTSVKYEDPPFRDHFSVGISARAELVMSIFSINVGIGKNIIGRGEDKGLLYEVLALKASVSPKLFLHTGCIFYSLQESRCLMLGLGYRL